jgi:RNA polymerase sigma-70 factor, ECF subfamily
MPQGRKPDDGTAVGNGPPAPQSFEGRIMALLPDLRRHSRSLTRSDIDGEDLLHDSVERILLARTTWSGTNLRAWVLTIMTNLYRNGTRRERRFPSVDIENAEALQTADGFGDPQERNRLARALDTLSPEFRAVLMLVVIEGYSYAEVAEIMKTPVGTVMSRLSRARAELSRLLAADNIIPLRRSE